MMIAGGIIGGKVPSIAHVDNLATEQDVGNTYTWTGRNFGPASEKRLLVLAARVSNANLQSGAPQSCTIGGVSATVIESSVGASTAMQLWYAHVPEGETGTITLTRPGGFIAGQWVLWAIHDLSRPEPRDSVIGVSAHPATAQLEVPGNGVAVGFCFVAADTSITWSGLNEDIEALTASGSGRYSGASADHLAASSAHTITVTTGNGTGTIILAASWR